MTDMPVIDLSVLDELIAQLGDSGEELRRILLDSYLIEGALRMADFKTAVDRNDFTTVLRVTHALKSSSALLGILPLADMLQQTEDAARADVPDITALAARVQSEYAQATQVISALLGKLPEDWGTIAPVGHQ